MNRTRIASLTAIAVGSFLIVFGLACLAKAGHVPGLRSIPAAEFKTWKPVPGTGGLLRRDPNHLGLLK